MHSAKIIDSRWGLAEVLALLSQLTRVFVRAQKFLQREDPGVRRLSKCVFRVITGIEATAIEFGNLTHTEGQDAAWLLPLKFLNRLDAPKRDADLL